MYENTTDILKWKKFRVGANALRKLTIGDDRVEQQKEILTERKTASSRIDA